jgi:threonine synthase
MGFCEYHQQQKCDRLPKMMGFQAAGSAPLVSGSPVAKPDTIATAIRIGNPANWEKAIAVKEASQGEFNPVTDAEILEAYQILGAEEGIFCEPASAASVAGLLKVKDRVPDDATVVCVLTGNGLKDPDSAISNGSDRVKQGVKGELNIVAAAMGF